MPGPRRRAASLTAALTLGALAAMPQSAFADLLAPDSPASPNASASRTAYIIMVVLMTLVAVGVIAAVVRAVRSGGDGEPERRTRGTVAIQRRVGAGLGVVVTILFILGVIFTERARDVDASTGAEPITIGVDGQQWIWRYEYPQVTDTSDGYSADTPFSYYDLWIPVDTPITLDVSSIDVRHRWWVPAIARAVDAVPGDVNSISFTADETGTYEGRSTEFSGAGYSTMRTAVHVVEPDEYEAFLARQIEDIDIARDAVQEAVEAGTAPGVALEEGG